MKGDNSASTTLILFGATGDLSKKKFIPALLNLYSQDKLPKRFSVIGISRKDFCHETYREFIKDALKDNEHATTEKLVDDFLQHLHYIPGDFSDESAYKKIIEFLHEHDSKLGQCSNKLFYISVPPDLYHTIFTRLGSSGLSKECSDGTGWTRIAVEKPFGRDLESAKELDQILDSIFKEKHVFRVDHYLGKEIVENILMFRFANSIFRPMWNSDHIDKVCIRLCETDGVSDRGAFYDTVGALRDIGQSHLLQILALMTMEDPSTFRASYVRRERERVLSSLQIYSGEDVKKHCKKGQYQGYLSEKGVKPDSVTETYFRIEASIDNERWHGTKFILESGKKMHKRITEIIVYFKELPSCMFESQTNSDHRNVLKFYIQPNEAIGLRFWVKKPGFSMDIEPHFFSLNYPKKAQALHAHEKLILSILRGDQELFVSAEEIEAAWSFITPILEAWDSERPTIYKPGVAMEE